MAHTHDILTALLPRIKCKPGWSLRLDKAEDDVYPKLVITVPGYDSAGASSTDAVLWASEQMDRVCQSQSVPAGGDSMLAAVKEVRECMVNLREAWANHRRLAVQHYRPVPEATYNEASWRRWLFDQCLALECHEMGEWFRDGDERPFQPLHGPGEDPYTVHEYRPLSDALTTQDGSMREPYR